MFVLPLARPVHRAVTPQFSRFIDRLLDESIDRAQARVPALDVSETDAGYALSFDVPGIAREQLKLSIDGRRVTVTTVGSATATAAEPNTAASADAPSARVLYRERSDARYARTVSLPAEVDAASATAKFENGVLTVSLEKKVATGAKQISIS